MVFILILPYVLKNIGSASLITSLEWQSKNPVESRHFGTYKLPVQYSGRTLIPAPTVLE